MIIFFHLRILQTVITWNDCTQWHKHWQWLTAHNLLLCFSASSYQEEIPFRKGISVIVPRGRREEKWTLVRWKSNQEAKALHLHYRQAKDSEKGKESASNCTKTLVDEHQRSAKKGAMHVWSLPERRAAQCQLLSTFFLSIHSFIVL